MVRLKHVAHMATLRLICPVVLLLKYYQIKIFAILFYAISAVRYFEFSRVSKQKCHVFFLNVKNIIDKVKFTLDKCGDVDVVVAMRTRNDFASAYVFVDYRNLPQLGRSNIRV